MSFIALVTGASRGAGRGIAAVLGERGATVYITGRSHGECTTENLPGTIQETAEEVTRRGGHGVAVVCDHTNDRDVERLFERIEQETGRIDLLVNNIWGGYEAYDGKGFSAPFWEQPTGHWEGMFVAGVRAHLMASRRTAPIMLRQGKGLIVSTIAWDRERYLGNLYYDVAKHAISRMILGMGRELRNHGVVAVAIAPGFMRTERVLAVVGDDPSFDRAQTESPEYVGRSIAALHADPDHMRWSGKTVAGGTLAREYGIVDIDGRYIPPFEIPE